MERLYFTEALPWFFVNVFLLMNLFVQIASLVENIWNGGGIFFISKLDVELVEGSYSVVSGSHAFQDFGIR